MSSFAASALTIWISALAYWDVRFFRLPNILTLGGGFAGLVWLAVNHVSFVGHQPASALMAAGFGALVTLPAYALKKLGAGDAKLLIAIGLLTSMEITVSAFVIGSLLAALLALSWLWIEQWHPFMGRLSHLPIIRSWVSGNARTRKMPFGLMLAIGLLVTLWAWP
jgi:prepilin peptidase CpaA